MVVEEGIALVCVALKPRALAIPMRWDKVKTMPVGAERLCLAHTGSLTAYLERIAGTACVLDYHGLALAPVFLDEALHLNVEGQAQVREVSLHFGRQAWVFARTIIPCSAWARCRGLFSSLGVRSLGVALFQSSPCKRGAIEVRQVHKDDPLGQRIVAYHGGFAHDLWARRSCFYFGQAPILVQEVFLQRPVPTRDAQAMVAG
jgi:chorismate-pyruvate lyase